jgi:hypothetical protein
VQSSVLQDCFAGATAHVAHLQALSRKEDGTNYLYWVDFCPSQQAENGQKLPVTGVNPFG